MIRSSSQMFGCHRKCDASMNSTHRVLPLVSNDTGDTPPVDRTLWTGTLLLLIVVENPISNVAKTSFGARLPELCSADRVIVRDHCVGLSSCLPQSTFSRESRSRSSCRCLCSDPFYLAIIHEVGRQPDVSTDYPLR